MVTTSVSNDTLALPLDGLGELQLRLGFGGGELVIGQAESGMLVSGTFEGGVIQKSKQRGRIELEPDPHGRPWHPVTWHVGVTAEIPVDLRLDTGANRSTIDLSALRIRRLVLNTGASETTIRLPVAGQTSVHVACGFATVNVVVPQGVAARVRGKVSLGSTKVDETRFPRAIDGWASADFETAVNRVDLAVEGGFGAVQVV
jgi:hypothetical protein